jgi:hypothetical protein
MWLMIKELEGMDKETAVNKEIYLPAVYLD